MAKNLSVTRYLYFLKKDLEKGIIFGYRTNKYARFDMDTQLAIMDNWSRIKKVSNFSVQDMQKITLTELNVLIEKATIEQIEEIRRMNKSMEKQKDD